MIMVENFVLAVAVLAGLASCTTSKKSVEPTAFQGEWNIVEMNGEDLSFGEVLPYVSFNVAESRFSGNAGCNMLNGQFDLNTKDGKISFGPVAATRMYCPDMELETSLINAIENIFGFEVSLTENTVDSILLKGENGQKILKLMKRSELDGHWNIVALNDSAVVTSEKIPFMDFRSNSGRVFGCFGCNSYNSSVEIDEAAGKIKFGNGAMTMMMCPDMDLERNIGAAVSEVENFSIKEDGTLILSNSKGKALLKLER